MNKLTKIGASALAGSLVSVSAYAGELSVSGIWEVTYKSDDSANVGNPFGSKSAIAFNGSGDVDGLGTATWFAAINDNNGSTLLSHMVTVDMGDLGSFGFDQGVGNTVHQLLMTSLQQHGKNHGTTQLTHQVV